jgi:hypothetical protein
MDDDDGVFFLLGGRIGWRVLVEGGEFEGLGLNSYLNPFWRELEWYMHTWIV